LAKIKARTSTEDLRGNGNILLKGKLKGGERVERTEIITMAQYRVRVKPKLNFGYHKT
jgi:hypothetical protein